MRGRHYCTLYSIHILPVYQLTIVGGPVGVPIGGPSRGASWGTVGGGHPSHISPGIREFSGKRRAGCDDVCACIGGGVKGGAGKYKKCQ